jgi:ribosomal protein S18 acetylase RimI-like enzyme
MMVLKIAPVSTNETEALLPILRDAEEGEERIRAALFAPTCTAYAAWKDVEIVGAAVIRWEKDANEILYIAVKDGHRGQGYGKQIITALLAELRARGERILLVGTANSSLENIAFYQKCDFRMFEIRRNYFAYIQPPQQEHGIPLRDMLVFCYEADRV